MPVTLPMAVPQGGDKSMGSFGTSSSLESLSVLGRGPIAGWNFHLGIGPY
jgi:hypothetical protein